MSLDRELNEFSDEDSLSKFTFYSFLLGEGLCIYTLYQFVEKGFDILSLYLDWHCYFNF